MFVVREGVPELKIKKLSFFFKLFCMNYKAFAWENEIQKQPFGKTCLHFPTKFSALFLHLTPAEHIDSLAYGSTYQSKLSNLYL